MLEDLGVAVRTEIAPLVVFCLWGSVILSQGLSVRLLDVSGQMFAQNKGMCKRLPVKWGTYHLCSFDTLTWSYQDNFYLLQTWHLVAHCQKEIFNLFLYYLQCMWNLCQDIIDNFYHKIAFLMPIRMKDSYFLQISSTKLLLTWPLWNICVNLFTYGEHIQLGWASCVNKFRYQKLLDICIKQQIGVLLIAHHSDDQVC